MCPSCNSLVDQIDNWPKAEASAFNLHRGVLIILSDKFSKVAFVTAYYLVLGAALVVMSIVGVDGTATSAVVLVCVLAPFVIGRINQFEWGGLKVQLREVQAAISTELADTRASVEQEVSAVRTSVEREAISVRASVDQTLEALASRTHDYLLPQALEVSDAVIQKLRDDPPDMSDEDIETALLSIDARKRIPAYVYLQVDPRIRHARALGQCMFLEQFEASKPRSTDELGWVSAS